MSYNFMDTFKFSTLLFATTFLLIPLMLEAILAISSNFEAFVHSMHVLPFQWEQMNICCTSLLYNKKSLMYYPCIIIASAHEYVTYLQAHSILGDRMSAFMYAVALNC